MGSGNRGLAQGRLDLAQVAPGQFQEVGQAQATRRVQGRGRGHPAIVVKALPDQGQGPLHPLLQGGVTLQILG